MQGDSRGPRRSRKSCASRCRRRRGVWRSSRTGDAREPRPSPARSRPTAARPRWRRCAPRAWWPRRSRSGRPRRRPPPVRRRVKIGGSVKAKDLAIYTRQFSTMVDAGLPIAQCLQILSEQSESKVLRDVTGAHRQRRRRAARRWPSPSASIPRPSTTSSSTCSPSASRAACSTSCCSGCPSYIEKAAKLKGKVKSAMVYPDHHHQRGRPRHHLHDGLRAAHLRQHVQEHGRRAAAAHEDRHLDVRLDPQVHHLHRSGIGAGHLRASSGTTHRPGQHGHRHASC